MAPLFSRAHRTSTTSLLLVGCISCSAGMAATPLTDGRCDEYLALGATTLALPGELTLNIFQDNDYVWMCYSYPQGSSGLLDLQLQTVKVKDPLNLHVSAQLGEWAVGEAAPDSPESERWWNATGWIANPIWVNGMDRSGGAARYRFRNTGAREIQLSKERFGRGQWKFSMNIRGIKGKDGKLGDIVFPAAGGMQALQVD